MIAHGYTMELCLCSSVQYLSLYATKTKIFTHTGAKKRMYKILTTKKLQKILNKIEKDVNQITFLENGHEKVTDFYLTQMVAITNPCHTNSISKIVEKAFAIGFSVGSKVAINIHAEGDKK